MSRVRLIFEEPAILAFELERGVFDFEVAGEAFAQSVEYLGAVRIPCDHHMGRDDIEPGGDRPGVQVVDVT